MNLGPRTGWYVASTNDPTTPSLREIVSAISSFGSSGRRVIVSKGRVLHLFHFCRTTVARADYAPFANRLHLEIRAARRKMPLCWDGEQRRLFRNSQVIFVWELSFDNRIPKDAQHATVFLQGHRFCV